MNTTEAVPPAVAAAGSNAVALAIAPRMRDEFNGAVRDHSLKLRSLALSARALLRPLRFEDAADRALKRDAMRYLRDCESAILAYLEAPLGGALSLRAPNCGEVELMIEGLDRIKCRLEIARAVLIHARVRHELEDCWRVVDVVEVMLEKCKALGPVLYAEHRITWGIHPEKRAAA